MVERILWWIAFLTISFNLAGEHGIAKVTGLSGAFLATYWVLEELYEWSHYKWRMKTKSRKR